MTILITARKVIKIQHTFQVLKTSKIDMNGWYLDFFKRISKQSCNIAKANRWLVGMQDGIATLENSLAIL